MLHRALTLMLLALALLALPAAGIPIMGRVQGPDGEPRAKAEVLLEAIPPTYERARLRIEGRPGPEPVARTRTAADGTFEIAAPEAGMWKVVVSARGVLTMEYRLIPLVDEAVLPPLEMPAAADLAVRIVDAGGKPHPGRIGAHSLNVRGNDWRPQLRLARAGEDGVAHLPLGEGERIQLEVLADGHPLQIYELFDETSVTIDVTPGVAGRVRVTGSQKRPLAGAVAFQGSALVPLGLTDEEGRLSLVLQAEKRPAVKVVNAERWNGSFDLDFDAGAKSDTAKSDTVKTLQLDPPATLSGRVLELSTRDPVAGALVWAVRGEVAMTDERGGYDLEVGVYKSRWVQAQASGYVRGFSQLRDAETRDVPPIALDPAAALSGRVVDSDGGLLPGVAIELAIVPGGGRMSTAARRMMRDGWRGRTSKRGVFRVLGLPARIGYQLEFQADGFAPLTLDVEPLEAFESRSGIEAVMLPGRIASGRVVDSGDVPVAGAEIRLEEPPPTDDMRASMRMARWRREEADEPVHFTDAEGRFEIADLAAGRYDLEARAAGFAPARVPGVRVGDGGGRTDFGTVVLVPGASIEGRVTGPDGTAIAGAEVTTDTERRGFMGMEPRPRDRAETDTQGRFVLADLLPGQAVTLAVTKEGFGTESVAGLRPPTEEPLAIVLRPAGRLKGKVVDRRGDPIEGATVHANPDHRIMRPSSMQQRRPAWARTDADGRFLIEDVEPGTLQVSANAEDYQQQVHQGIEVVAGEEREIELVLEKGAVVEGTVTSADGEPVVQVSINVSARTEGHFSGMMVSGRSGGRTDIEGRYRIAGAPEGPVTISVRDEVRQRLEKNVELRPGTNVVDLVLERGFEVTGQVVGPEGLPLAGAAISIQEATQPGMVHFSYGPGQAASSAGGLFTLTGVTAGKYAVTASKEGYAPASSEPFEVSADVTGLLLELSRGAVLKGRIVGLEFDELGSLALTAYSQQGGMRRGRVDFSAEYAFDGLAPGQWHVQAQVAGSGRSTTMQVEIPEGVPETLKDIEFGTGFALTGIVLDGGQPLAGANVSASSPAAGAGHGQTGRDGRFRIESLKPGSYQVMVMAGMGMQHMEALELAGDHDLRIEISTGTVSGLVLDAEGGEPLPGVAVTLEQLDGGGDSVWARQFNYGNRGESDSRGFFLVPRVRQGNWRVVATKPGYAPGEATVVVAGGAAPEVDIRLTPTEGVSFEVVLESGAALTAVQVTILAPSGSPLAGGNHPVIDGRVKVSTVPPGRWNLLIQGGDSAATLFAVNSPSDQGRVLLRTGGMLHITVPELEQVLMASVRLTGPGGQPFIAPGGISMPAGQWMMSAGQSMVPGLVPGVWSFTIEHDGRTWSGSAAVTAGGTTEVSVP